MRVGRYIIGANYWPHIDWQSLVSVKYATCTSSIMHSLCAPKILHNLFFSLLLGITVIPREIENNAYAKFEGGGGANKAHYGKCASGVWAIFYYWPSGWPLAQWTLDLCWYFSVLLLELESVLEFLKIKKRMFFQKKRARKLKELHINTFCLCLSVVKDWVRKKILYPQAISALLEEDSIWLLLKEFVRFLFLHRSISNCILTKMWRIKQLLIHHLHWRGLTQCLGLLSR